MQLVALLCRLPNKKHAVPLPGPLLHIAPEMRQKVPRGGGDRGGSRGGESGARGGAGSRGGERCEMTSPSLPVAACN